MPASVGDEAITNSVSIVQEGFALTACGVYAATSKRSFWLRLKVNI